MFERVARHFIKDYDETESAATKFQYRVLAGKVAIAGILALFLFNLAVGLAIGSVSVVALSLTLLSNLMNSLVLLVSAYWMAKPETDRNPYGYGRLEQVAPLIMAIILLTTGVEVLGEAYGRVIKPQPLQYLIFGIISVAGAIGVKHFLSKFIRYLGNRVESKPIISNANHHKSGVWFSLLTLTGLILDVVFQLPVLDGIVGLVVGGWMIYLGTRNAYNSIIPIVGEAPKPELIAAIKEVAKSVKHVEDVHEVIIHDYGEYYIISLHAEIPEELGPARIHEVSEDCEEALRRAFPAEVVVHSDPLQALTPETQALQQGLEALVTRSTTVTAFHDFRVVRYSPEKWILLADLDLAPEVPVSEYRRVVDEFEEEVAREIPHIAYCGFAPSPKFAY